jgi:hypothetical protein
MALKRVEVTRLPGAAGWLGLRWSWNVQRTNPDGWSTGISGQAVTKYGAMRAMKRAALELTPSSAEGTPNQ